MFSGFDASAVYPSRWSGHASRASLVALWRCLADPLEELDQGRGLPGFGHDLRGPYFFACSA